MKTSAKSFDARKIQLFGLLGMRLVLKSLGHLALPVTLQCLLILAGASQAFHEFMAIL